MFSMQHFPLFLVVLQHLQLKKNMQIKYIESTISAVVYWENCVATHSGIQPLTILSTLLFAPHFLADIDHPATQYSGPSLQGNDP